MIHYEKFNVNEVTTTSASTYKPKDPITAGIYRGFITKLNWKENFKKNGKYLSVGITVIDCSQLFPDTRQIIQFLNLNNLSEFSVKKAREQFAELCNALDIENVDYNSEQGIGPHEYERFLGKEVKVLVGVKENTNGLRINTIEKFYGSTLAATSIPTVSPPLNPWADPKVPDESSSEPIQFSVKPATEFSDLNDDIPF